MEWNEYLRYCEEAHDEIPCVILDEIKHLGLPKNKFVTQLDMNDPSSIHAAREIIITHLPILGKKVKAERH